MRKAKVFSHEAVMPRMSWSPKNLYNLIARSTVPMRMSQTSFTKTSMTMYQQRWRSKRFLRGYHGDWVPEKRFKRWFLPHDLPRYEPPQVGAASTSGSSSGPRMGGAFDRTLKLRRSVQGAKTDGPPEMERMPTASLFMRDIERRLDVVVFRCCFARSAYEARAHIVQGKVKLNGQKCNNPNVQLNPGDLITVEPEAIPMLSKEMEKKALKARAAEIATGEGSSAPTAEEDDAAAAAQEATDAAAEAAGATGEAEGSSKPAEATEATEAAASEGGEASGEATAADAVDVKGKGKAAPAQPKQLPPGVRPFNLPDYAAPFLFIPPYLETSFTTCSAIYIRHPTIVPHKNPETNTWTFRTDLPSPYPAGGELYSMAWEHYARNAPRVRGEARRLKLEGRVGRSGFVSARARDMDRKRSALRRGWGRTKEVRGWRETLLKAQSQASPRAASA